MSRNKNRRRFANIMDHMTKNGNRNEKIIRQYTTPMLSRITPAGRGSLINQTHIWKTGDRYSKLAAVHYGDPALWWIIAWYNGTPTEAHLKLGDKIQIPAPLERVLKLLRVF